MLFGIVVRAIGLLIGSVDRTCRSDWIAIVMSPLTANEYGLAWKKALGGCDDTHLLFI